MTPFLSIIIPVKSINYYIIFENLPALEVQTYRDFECIVLPNEHTQYDLELLKKYKWLRIIPTGTVTRPAQKRDIGVREAKGEVVAFIDDDAAATPEWLANAVQTLKKKGVEAVCGPGVIPPRADFWEQVFDEILKTRIGSGGYSYRFISENARYVDDYPSMNFFIKKNVFLKIGGFNSDYWPGEDSKLCNDLVYKEHGKIYYDPSIIIYHHRRKELGGYLKQHGNYGFHRGAFFAHGDANSRRLTYLVPTFFTLYILALLATLLLSVVFPIPKTLITLFSAPAFLYAVGLLFLFLSAFIRTKNPILAIISAFVLVLMHGWYGIMFVKGYYRGISRKTAIYD